MAVGGLWWEQEVEERNLLYHFDEQYTETILRLHICSWPPTLNEYVQLTQTIARIDSIYNKDLFFHGYCVIDFGCWSAATARSGSAVFSPVEAERIGFLQNGQIEKPECVCRNFLIDFCIIHVLIFYAGGERVRRVFSAHFRVGKT